MVLELLTILGNKTKFYLKRRECYTLEMNDNFVSYGNNASFPRIFSLDCKTD